MRVTLIGCMVALISTPAWAQPQGKKQGAAGGQISYQQCMANMTRMGLKGGEAAARCSKLAQGRTGHAK